MSTAASKASRIVCSRVLATFLCFAGHGFPQASGFEGKSILELRYDPEQQPLAPRDLERVQLVRVGAPFRSSDIAETIDRMFATGRYEDIQVDAETRSTGVAIRFITRNARFVGHIGTVGRISTPPNQGQIVSAAQLELGNPFHPEDLGGAEENIRQLFISNGLYEAQVHLETVEDPEHQQVNVRVVVSPGKRARYETPLIRGDTKLPDATIIRATGWRVILIGRWRGVTQTLTKKGTDGVEKKYQSRDRLAASVELASLDYDPKTVRAKPTLNINAGPTIQVKAAEAKVSKRVLRRYIPVYQEGTVDRDLLVEGARNLRDYFQAKGYPDVDVTFSEPVIQADEQTIQYSISRGPRRKLVKLEIKGNKFFDTETIRERMFLQPSSFRLRWGRYSEAFRQKDEETIVNLYKASGFRDAKVTSDVQNDYKGKAHTIAVIFTVAEGPQWVVTRLEINGVKQLRTDSITPMLSSGDGQPYSDVDVAADRNSIMTYCYSNGFRHAKFEWSATPAEAPHQVILRYNLTEGEQEFVREAVISGLKNTRLSLVEKNLRIQAGDPLSMSQIRAAQRRLYDLSIFAKIDTAVQDSDGDEIEKNVLYDFDEAHRYSMRLGGGAEIAQIGGTSSNLNAPTGFTGFSPRVSVDLNRLNMFGIGHTVSLQTRASTLEQRISLSYFDPRLFNAEGRTLTFTALYDSSHDVLTFASRREEASVQLSQKVSKPSTLFFRFAYRRVSTTNIVIPTLLVPQLLQPVRIGILSGNWIQDRRDNPVDAHKGMYNTVDVGIASNVFGSQRNFTRILARNATYHRLSKDWVLARQLTFGAILPFNMASGSSSSDYVPLPERFFAGGSVSDRGFPENQAGPRDVGVPAGPGGAATVPTGFPLGGNAVFISNIELRFPLIGENIGGVLFHDAGNVYRTIGDVSFRTHQNGLQDFDYMVHAVGFGIRYKTPIGPLRLDLAYSINPPRFVGFQGQTIHDLLACNPNIPVSQLPAACQGVPQGVSHFQFFFSIGQTF